MTNQLRPLPQVLDLLLHADGLFLVALGQFHYLALELLHQLAILLTGIKAVLLSLLQGGLRKVGQSFVEPFDFSIPGCDAILGFPVRLLEFLLFSADFHDDVLQILVLVVELDHLVIKTLLLLLPGGEGPPLLEGPLHDLHEVVLRGGGGLEDLANEELPLGRQDQGLDDDVEELGYFSGVGVVGNLDQVDLLALQLLVELPVPELLDAGVQFLQVAENVGKRAGTQLQLHHWELFDLAEDFSHAHPVREVLQTQFLLPVRK